MMMIHSFNVNECGGYFNEEGRLVLGERGTRINEKGKYIGERIDNANGIVKALKMNVDEEGKLSKKDTEKVLEILHQCRTAGLYEDSTNKIESSLRKAFGLSSSDSLTFRYIYKNSEEPGKLTTRGKISKWFKGISDRLMYMFTGEKDPQKLQKQETPKNKTIGLEIFVTKNGETQQVEIPIGVFTSPQTLLTTKGFEKLRDIYL
jgi:hypothetical protein